MSIITTTDLETYIEGDVELGRATQVVNAVNASIESTTGRTWGSESTQTEILDYQPVLFLKSDVKSITSVKYGVGGGNKVTLDASSYFVNPGGRLVLNNTQRLGFQALRGYLEVTYKTGVADIPDDLKFATLALAADYYNYAAGGNNDITESQVGSYRVKYGDKSNSVTGMSLNATINKYRTYNV